MVGSIRPSLKTREMITANQPAGSRRIKYFLLISFIVSAGVGLNYAGLMDPISFLFRSLALSIFPAIGIGLRDFFEVLAFSDFNILNYLGYCAETLVAHILGYENKVFQTGWIISFLFLVILFFNRIIPRF